MLNGPSMITITAHVDFKEKNLDNVTFVKVNSMPSVGENSSSVHESKFVRNIQHSNFKKLQLTNTNRMTLNTQTVNDNQVFTKFCADQFHQ